jgi:hypothetical protein
MTQQDQETGETAGRIAGLGGKLDAAGWALFFIWVGIALLLDFGWGVGLVGLGVITLGMQVVRILARVKLDGFWVVVGLLFLVGGLWELIGATVPLLPILLIIIGIVLIVSTFGRKFVTRRSSE